MGWVLWSLDKFAPFTPTISIYFQYQECTKLFAASAPLHLLCLPSDLEHLPLAFSRLRLFIRSLPKCPSSDCSSLITLSERGSSYFPSSPSLFPSQDLQHLLWFKMFISLFLCLPPSLDCELSEGRFCICLFYHVASSTLYGNTVVTAFMTVCGNYEAIVKVTRT